MNRGFPQDLGPYDEMTDEELDKILAGKAPDPGEAARKKHAEKLGQEYKAPETLPDPADEEKEEDDVDEEAEADEVEDDADDVEEDEEEEESPEPEKAEEKDPASKLEDRLALLEKRLALEELRRQKSDAARERAELLASKHAGRAGYYKQQVERKVEPAPKAKDPMDPFTDDAGDDEKSVAPQRQEQQAPADPQWDDARAELVTMAINDEGVKYSAQIEPDLASIPEATREEFKERLAELVQEEAVPYKEVFQTSSLKAVRKLARSIMQSAYATARIEWMDKMTEAASERQAESTEKSRRRKKKAAISKSGAAPKRKRRRAKSYEDMSDSELEQEFAKEFGDNYKQSRNSLS